MILGQFARVANFNVIFFTETADASFAGRMAALPRVPACFSGRISLDAVLRPLSSERAALASPNSEEAGALRPLPSDVRPLSSALSHPSSERAALASPYSQKAGAPRHPVSAFPLSAFSFSALRPPSSVFYLSGPPVMLKTLSDELRSRAVTSAQIRTDAWE
jgi:hypothetical protein